MVKTKITKGYGFCRSCLYQYRKGNHKKSCQSDSAEAGVGNRG